MPTLFTHTAGESVFALQQMYGQSQRLTLTSLCAALMSAETQKGASMDSTDSLTTAATSAGPGHWKIVEKLFFNKGSIRDWFFRERLGV